MNNVRKPSYVQLEAVSVIEAARLRTQGRDPDDFVAVLASSTSVNVSVGDDGLATISIGFRVPTSALRFLDAQPGLPPGLPLPTADGARSLRAALGARPLVRLVILRDQLRLPADAPPVG